MTLEYRFRDPDQLRGRTVRLLLRELNGWSREELNQRLREIMAGIHESCVEYGSDRTGSVDYVKGANIAGFVKLADVILAYGIM